MDEELKKVVDHLLKSQLVLEKLGFVRSRSDKIPYSNCDAVYRDKNKNVIVAFFSELVRIVLYVGTPEEITFDMTYDFLYALYEAAEFLDKLKEEDIDELKSRY